MSNVFLLIIDSVCGDRNGYVPDVLFTTIELPAELPIVGEGCLIQAR